MGCCHWHGWDSVLHLGCYQFVRVSIPCNRAFSVVQVHLLTSGRVLQGWYQVHQLEDRTASEISWIGSTQALFVFGGGVIGGPLFDLYGAKVPSIEVHQLSNYRADFRLLGYSAGGIALCCEHHADQRLQGVSSVCARSGHSWWSFQWHDHISSDVCRTPIFQQETRRCHGNRDSGVFPRRCRLAHRPK